MRALMFYNEAIGMDSWTQERPANHQMMELYCRSASGEWMYSITARAKLVRNVSIDSLPKTIQLYIFLEGVQ